MQIKSITTRDELIETQEQWDSLFERAECAVHFLSFEWLALWTKHFDSLNNWEILTAWDGGQLIGAAPMIFVKGRAHFIADTSLADYMDFLAAEADMEKVVTALMDALSQKPWKTLTFKRLHDGKARALMIAQVAQQKGFKSDTSLNCISPRVTTEQGWEDYYASRSRKLRADQRTTVRNLEKHGAVQFSRPESSDKENIYTQLCALQAGRQDLKAGHSFMSDPATRAFLKEALQYDWADISTINIDGENISIIYGILFNNKFHCWISGFNNAFIKHSVGKLHFKSLIEDTFMHNRAAFDMMIGAESYKLRWATGEIENYEVTIYRTPFIAFKAHAFTKIRAILKDIKNHSTWLSKLWVRLSKFKK